MQMETVNSTAAINNEDLNANSAVLQSGGEILVSSVQVPVQHQLGNSAEKHFLLSKSMPDVHRSIQPKSEKILLLKKSISSENKHDVFHPLTWPFDRENATDTESKHSNVKHSENGEMIADLRSQNIWSRKTSNHWPDNPLDAKKNEPEAGKTGSVYSVPRFEGNYDNTDIMEKEANPILWTSKDNDPNDGGSRRGKGPPRQFLDYFILFGGHSRIQNRPHSSRRPEILIDRSGFLAKVMVVKALKWLAICALVISSQHFKFFTQFSQLHFWIICISIVVYLFAFILLRSCPSCQTIPGCIFSIVVCTICLGSIGSMFYSILGTTLIRVMIFTLALTYSTLATLNLFVKLDVTKDNILPLILFLVLSFSLVSFITECLILRSRFFVTSDFTTVWFPSMMITECLTIMEMAEIKAILDGLRSNVRRFDWIIVAAFLI